MGDITFFTYAMGLSSILVVGTGLITGMLLFIRYSRTRNPAVLTVMLLILSMGLTWTGTAVSFFLVLAGEEPLDEVAYALITLTPLSLIGPLLLYSTMDMLPAMKKRLSIALGIMIILALACLFMAYFQTEDVYEEYKIHEESGLGEGSYKGVVRIVIAIYILFTLFFLAPLYTYVGAKTSVQDTRRKTGLLALGYGLFGFFAIFDGLVTLDAIQVIIVRAGLASALLSIYLGYTLPSWVDSLIDAIASKIRK